MNILACSVYLLRLTASLVRCQPDEAKAALLAMYGFIYSMGQLARVNFASGNNRAASAFEVALSASDAHRPHPL
jgi:hypothetical protein